MTVQPLYYPVLGPGTFALLVLAVAAVLGCFLHAIARSYGQYVNHDRTVPRQGNHYGETQGPRP